MAKAPKRISIDLLDDDLKARLGGESGESTAVDWTSILNKPTEFVPSNHTHSEFHTHINKGIIDSIKQDDVDKWNNSTNPHNHNDLYYSQLEVDNLLSGKSNADHTHAGIAPSAHTHLEKDITDLDKYTKVEVDAKLLGKSDNTHNHDGRYNTKSEISGLLSNKAEKVHSHTKSNISDFEHTHLYSAITNPPVIPTDTQQLTKSDVYTKSEIDTMVVATGAGDMVKAIYDTDDDGKVNHAEIADSVKWDGVIDKPTVFNPDVHTHLELHSHINKGIIDLTEEVFTTILKNKLDGLNNYTHPTGDGNLHVPSNGTTNAGKVLKSTNVAGSIGWGNLSPADVGSAPASHMHTIAQITNFPTFSRFTLSAIQPTDGYWLKVVD